MPSAITHNTKNIDNELLCSCSTALESGNGLSVAIVTFGAGVVEVVVIVVVVVDVAVVVVDVVEDVWSGPSDEIYDEEVGIAYSSPPNKSSKFDALAVTFGSAKTSADAI